MVPIKINIKLIGVFKGISGISDFFLEFNKTITIKDLVNELGNIGSKFNKAFIDSELQDPRPNALILVNNQDIELRKGLHTLLEDGDIITFIPISHGG